MTATRGKHPHVQHWQPVSRRFRAGLLAVCGVLVVVETVPHAADPSPAAARAPLPSRDAQERARAMARELVATALDVQLRQLEDNGLEQLPLHAEIKAMRGNIEGLVGNEMQGVVDLLAKAESAEPGDQAQAVQESRRLIRHVTIRLSAERQMLLRRLKVADIAAQVRRLTRQQSAVLRATEALPQQLPGRREAVTLAALEQQRTTGSLYSVLVASLEDVRTWEGPIGATSTESLRRLRDGQAEAILTAAEQRLATSDFAAAAAAQRQVLDLLATLEQRIERSQAASASRTGAAAAVVRDMQRQREELRVEIAKAPPTDAAIEALVEKQSALREELSKLDEVAATAPDVAPLVQKAKEAAIASTEKLFEGDTRQSVVEEGKVLGSLAEIADRLMQSAPVAADAKSAEQLAKQLDELRKAATQMPPADPARQQAEHLIADAARSQAATKIAELARAAEAIERAAATERELARAAEQAAANPGQPPLDPAVVKAEQETVAAVAEKVAEAIKATAPEAAAAVEKARPLIAQNRPAEAAVQLAQAAAEIRREASETARELEAMTQSQREQTATALEQAEARLGDQPVGDPQAAAERVAVNLAIREAELAREQAMAENISAQAAVQEEARDTIAQLGDKLAAAAVAAKRKSQPRPGEAQPPDAAAGAAEALQQAEVLQHAEAEFAGAQQAIGEDAAAIAGQNEIANQPLRDALERASQLAPAAALAQPALQAMESASPSIDEPPAPLGTGFVPQSPEATAEMIAGHEAQAAAEAVLAEAARRDEAAGESMPGNEMPEPQSAEQLATQLEELKTAAAQATQGEERRHAADAIADLERAEAATKVAELARAAEAIERAAAAERELARVAEQAAANPGQPQPDAAAIKAVQQNVAAVAEKVAEAIKNTAPEAAAAVEKAKPPIAANKPAEAAEALLKAASEIRREAAETAKELALVQESRLEQATRELEAMAAAKEPPSREEAAEQAARVAELSRAKQLADKLANDMAAQQQARDAIADRSAELVEESAGRTADGAKPSQDVVQEGARQEAAQSAAARETAQALRKAQEEFAAGQEAAGETAAALAGQNELANAPLREGLERASQLDSGPAAAKPEEQARESASPSTSDQPAPLGTGFVPESSESTAERIAGSEAEAAAEKLLGPAADRGAKGEATAESTSPAGKPKPHPGKSVSKASKKPDRSQAARQGEAKSDGLLEPMERVDKNAVVAGTRAGDADQAAKSFEQESWFAKLPPEMRQAIRAKSQRRAPRGYEEKLDRYFRNID
ncbi:MAG: hypothetical protein HQ464_16415 [Planctomycetes bacterium]|nr:hypothetical protein [Planctomycetota bacterium]